MKTIIEFFESPMMRLCILISLGMSGIAVYNWIPWSGLTPSDWGTWIGAIGTVATLAGTIWLATSEQRLRKRAERDLALITVAGLMWRIQAVETGLGGIKCELDSGLRGEVFNDYHEILMKFELLPLWTPTELTALVSIENHVAARLAFCGETVVSIKQFIAQEVREQRYIRNDLGRRLFNTMATNRLVPVIDQTGDVKDDCFLFWNSCRLNESFRRGRRTASRD
ncbi:hypothetical protein [Janthinobacterium sp. NKUCC06_STL]|uniref:hypothetical protein n=1 Tax=Janthinobacterium sp. NKUCC06_STL TaxID=2842127 RepID=UPI001C5BE7AB|nr:hypothetical protein [Janthinobacterium sp. NKUCC06_STL]MBW3512888.1 hypothetical protein [Janthinobacterium sp. NKUCC06_STL]